MAKTCAKALDFLTTVSEDLLPTCFVFLPVRCTSGNDWPECRLGQYVVVCLTKPVNHTSNPRCRTTHRCYTGVYYQALLKRQPSRSPTTHRVYQHVSLPHGTDPRKRCPPRPRKTIADTLSPCSVP